LNIQDSILNIQDTILYIQDSILNIQDTILYIQDSILNIQDTILYIQDSILNIQDKKYLQPCPLEPRRGHGRKYFLSCIFKILS